MAFKGVADQLNKMPSAYLWALADSALLQAIARGEPVERGPRGQRLSRLFIWANRLGLARALLLVTGCVELLKLLRRQGPPREPKGDELPATVFVGFGAGPEESLFARYTTEHGTLVARLNQIDVATFSAWQQLGFAAAMRTLWEAQHAAWQAVSQLPAELKQYHLDFLTFAAMRLGLYSYMLAWFQGLGDRRPSVEEVCFLAADTPAFAAVDAGLPTRYLQHGLIRHSLLLPPFDRIDALTTDEQRHFQQRLPRAKVRRETFPDIGAQGLSDGVLIASIYGDRTTLAAIEPLIEWLSTQHVTIRVRPHPCEQPGYWAALGARFQLQIEATDPSFITALQRLRPRLVVSWYSTALADALQCGIVAVTVNDSTSPSMQDMVYPLLKRALQWPRDQADIVCALSDTGHYRRILRRLQQD